MPGTRRRVAFFFHDCPRLQFYLSNQIETGERLCRLKAGLAHANFTRLVCVHGLALLAVLEQQSRF